jgi:acyl-coenzyme A thioesterase PaaI-like protein
LAGRPPCAVADGQGDRLARLPIGRAAALRGRGAIRQRHCQISEDDVVANQDIERAMVDQGWKVLTDAGFVGLVGPFFQMDTPTGPHFAFPTDARHHNLRGVLQGGALMTFADRVLGVTARALTHAARTATVQLNVQFIDAVQIGELVETRPTMLRATRSLMFMTTILTVGPRTVGSANGVWKKLAAPAG